jgi:hypothetical protein
VFVIFINLSQTTISTPIAPTTFVSLKRRESNFSSYARVVLEKPYYDKPLENYYDVAKADEFERLFGHLAIGQNPTPKHNQYFVMVWDFSAVSPDAHQIEQTLHRYINSCIQDFADYYQALLPGKIRIEPVDAIDSFLSLLRIVRQTPYPLYLLIDEYDNFANEMMMGSQELSKSRYDTLLSGEGLLKTVFKTVKSASAGRGLDRVFISGISPVVLSDITSGYNVAENIYLKPKFNDLCGFRQEEIESVLRQILVEWKDPAGAGLKPAPALEGALSLMRNFYDGYCFAPRLSSFVYNLIPQYFGTSFSSLFFEVFPRDMSTPPSNAGRQFGNG